MHLSRFAAEFSLVLAGFENSQGVMNQEVKYLLETTASLRETGWQPNKVWTDAFDYVSKLPVAAPGAVNSMRGWASRSLKPSCTC